MIPLVAIYLLVSLEAAGYFPALSLFSAVIGIYYHLFLHFQYAIFLNYARNT